ncbi:hypothetical protein HMPREF0765_4691 [Sphingobacterium spiritivorum ATCC 33300]|uniref:Uncharacterized protein n=1 Tax=Sphingobacterium spiritivorum ATCC 33300 TaxID=525372 RepID=C2G535_SPHSI|nr:hypothetical protein HMPREF0765_4691 [Sphingobacterium spiritivorum ATCC 33300]
MKAIHNFTAVFKPYFDVVVNIIKSKNESNSQQNNPKSDFKAGCCKYH